MIQFLLRPTVNVACWSQGPLRVAAHWWATETQDYVKPHEGGLE